MKGMKIKQIKNEIVKPLILLFEFINRRITSIAQVSRLMVKCLINKKYMSIKNPTLNERISRLCGK